jgi:hypothetical protein
LSLRRKVSHFLALVVVAALAVGLMAGPASAKVSASKKAQISRQLRQAIKHNPKVVNKRWFMKKASLVNFKLPVTIRLRGSSANTNPNRANIDLGASLGQREIDLGGSLAAEIVFHDSYDGGALGNVDVNILPGPKALTSTSVPLLWNTQVSDPTTSWDSNLLGNPAGYPGPGCGNVHTANTNGFGNLPFGVGALPSPGGPGLPGVPIYPNLATYAAHGSPTHFAPAHVGAPADPFNNSIDAVGASRVPGNDDNVGGNPDPFPSGVASDPGADGTNGAPTAADTVLRTNALNLTVAPSGTEISQNVADGVSGGQNIVLGKSGGQANLFGNIPGKGTGIDVTVNLATRINSIFRVVDQDAFEPLITGGNWPAAVFSCGEIWSGGVQNYIPAVHLKGSLKIAPAITSDGRLRIAKATLTQLGDPSRVSLAACLAPYAAYNAEQNSSDTVTPTVPGPASIGQPDGTLALGSLPVNTTAKRAAPAANCNAAPTAFVASTALPPSTVGSLSPAAVANGYSPTTGSGSAVSVAGDLTVSNVSADILVGDTP